MASIELASLFSISDDRFRQLAQRASPSTTLAMARPLVLRVRAIADERDVLISALVYTAVLLHLDEAPRSVAAA